MGLRGPTGERVFVTVIAYSNELTRYYYARQKYGWDEQQMSSYLFNYRLAYLASLWVLIPLLSNVAKLSDNIIGIIACLTTAMGQCVLYLFSAIL